MKAVVHPGSIFVAAAMLAAGEGWAQTASPSRDWPQFLGPNRDNFSAETGLLREWPEDGPPLLWTAQGLGKGFSSVSIAGGRVFTMGSGKREDVVIALQLQDGGLIWSAPAGPHFEKSSGDGPRSTPTVDGGRVYALGATGELACLDAASGAVRWQVNLLEEYRAREPQHGMRESVLVDGGRVICTPGGRDAAIVALDATTGNEIWRFNDPPAAFKASYASPIVFEAGGVRQYAIYYHRGIVGLRAEDGALLWHDESTYDTENCTVPVFHDDCLFYTSSGRGGGVLLKLTGNSGVIGTKRVYQSEDLANLYGGVVLVGDHLYGFNGSHLACIEFLTGRTVWDARVNRGDGRSIDRHGNITCADGHLYVRGYGGGVALVEATPEEYRLKGGFLPGRRGRATRTDSDPFYAQIVVADGKMFLREGDGLHCYDVREK